MRQRRFTLWRMLSAVCALGWADFTLKYRGSVLGYLWSFMAPLTRFLVILFVFQPFVGLAIPQYPLYLFLGVIIWEHFAGMTTACLSLPFEKSSIIQHVRFPRILLLLSVAWSHLLIFLTHLAVFFAFALWFGVPAGFSVLYLVLILAQMTFLALGVGGSLSAFVLRYRDLRHLWDVLLTVLFWLTPIMYPYRIAAPTLQELLLLPQKLLPLSFHEVLSAFVRFQPLSVLLYDARRSVLYAETIGAPSLFHALGFSFLCLIVCTIGLWLFHYRSRSFLDEY